MFKKMSFTVTYVDGQKVEVHSRPATEVAFERRFDRTIGSLFADISSVAFDTEEERRAAVGRFLVTLHTDYLYFLAWHSSKSQQPYDEWLENVTDIDWGFVADADPTSPAPPPGP